MARALLLLCLLGVHQCCSAATLGSALSTEHLVEKGDDGTWSSIARCAIAAQPLNCVEARSQYAVDAMLAPGGRAASGDTALEPEIVDKVGELSEIMVQAAAVFLERKMGLRVEQDLDEASNNLVDEGRGHKKKKKIHKLIALVKLVLLVLVVKLKLAFLMMALQTLFQFKIMVIVFLILLCKKISLWATLKNKHNQDAHKVVYYEHAQHQHHYDDGGHGWNAGHDEHQESPGWGGLWGRSYETPAEQDGVGVQGGVYRAADGTRIVVRNPESHDMAYAAQRP